MRIIFFGTPEIALPSFERLIAGPFDVVGAVSQPDRRRGRGRSLSPSPVSELALEAGIPLLRPEKVAETRDALAALTPDVGVVIAFGQFIPEQIRELPKQGFLINAHASLLPKYRGAAPINHAILAGEKTTGISVMRVDREMDAGPVALRREVEIGENETAGELTDRMAQLAAEALEAALEQIDTGSLHWTEQDHDRASFAGKLTREMAEINWSDSAEAITRRVRAFAPKPGAFTHLDGEILRILAGQSVPGDIAATPGTVDIEAGTHLRVATGQGWFLPTRIQRAGGKEMPVDAFLRGRNIATGARFGAEPKLDAVDG
ncbi:MAG: methionyl-tRNA formyltransferase [Myxococcales bacterium]|nr:methionyl-tRNA formyltransferase [Myxococcales bacterium]